MSRRLRGCAAAAAALLLVATMSGCAVGGVGYDGDVYVGGFYDAPGVLYGGWGPGYRVGPPRGRGGFARGGPAVRGGGGRAAPSIPSRARGR